MPETLTDLLRRTVADLHSDADDADREGHYVTLRGDQVRAFAALLEAVADDDPGDPLHDPGCRTCTAALATARAYLGEETGR